MHPVSFSKFSLFLFFCFTAYLGKAQLVTNSTIPADQLVQNTLLGNGVTATNITFSGFSSAIGFFDGSNSNIGLDSGIIMTTGTASDTMIAGNQAGPIGPNNVANAGFNNNRPGDTDLEALLGPNFNTMNAAVLEFDFVPTGDTVRFNYVFASEEYPEFAPPNPNSINDVFAFFLSGPGITGQQNIALLPGTNTPVSINSVNAVTNQAFFIPNGDGQSAPQNTDNTVVQYDGFTSVLTAQAIVTPCATYHIKLAISDVSDGALDSGVFLEAESFAAPQIEVNVSGASNLLIDSTIVEGCTGADFIFTRPNTAMADTIFYEISGNAINGVDYAQIADSVIFPIGVDSVVVTLFPIDDNIDEGTDTVVVTAFTINGCGDTTISQGVLFIIDSVTIITDAPDLLLNCPQDSVTIEVNATGGIPPVSYLWNNGETTSSFRIPTPAQTDTFYVTISDSCSAVDVRDTVIVTLDYPQPASVTVTPNQTVPCPGTSVTLNASVTGANPNISWSNGGSGPSIVVNPQSTTSYTASVIDSCGNAVGSTVTVTVPVNPPVSIIPPSDQLVCRGGVINVTATPSGGAGNYTIGYSGTGVVNNTDANGVTEIEPSSSGTFTVTATDQCGVSGTNTFEVTVELCSVTVPNVFTPNNDGLNDVWYIKDIERFPGNRVQVYNRWGKMVFEATDYDNRWDGENLSEGQYFYVIDLNNDNNEPETGSFSLLRAK